MCHNWYTVLAKISEKSIPFAGYLPSAQDAEAISNDVANHGYKFFMTKL